jgi:hypothetical protein
VSAAHFDKTCPVCRRAAFGDAIVVSSETGGPGTWTVCKHCVSPLVLDGAHFVAVDDEALALLPKEDRALLNLYTRMVQMSIEQDGARA